MTISREEALRFVETEIDRVWDEAEDDAEAKLRADGLDEASIEVVMDLQRADWREAKAEQLGEVAAWLHRKLH